MLYRGIGDSTWRNVHNYNRYCSLRKQTSGNLTTASLLRMNNFIYIFYYLIYLNTDSNSSSWKSLFVGVAWSRVTENASPEGTVYWNAKKLNQDKQSVLLEALNIAKYWNFHDRRVSLFTKQISQEYLIWTSQRIVFGKIYV